MISAPTNPVSVIRVGTGVLDRPLIQRNLRTVREAGPYEHRVSLCEIKELPKPESVGMFEFFCKYKNRAISPERGNVVKRQRGARRALK